ncbi:MAG: hypothetical protein V1797_11230 [Pseudomonadota bacterium]
MLSGRNDQRSIFKQAIDKLFPGYTIDAGAASNVAESLIETPGCHEAIIRLINSANTDVDRNNIELFVRIISDIHPKYSRLIKKGISRKGRIVKSLRPLIRRAIEPEMTQKKALATLPPLRGEKNNKLVLDAGNTSLANIQILFRQLLELSDEITIEMPDFVYASGLAIVAAWLKAKSGRTIERGRLSRSTLEYSRRIGFLDVIQDVATANWERQDLDGEWSIRLTPITQQSRAEKVTAEVLNILELFGSIKPDDKSTFGIILSELIENVPRHAETATPAYIVCQVYPEKLKLGITIADAGIGIKESFLRGETEKYKRPEMPDSYFINLALDMLVTSKTSRHAGYGLYLFSEVVARNRGTFVVSSGVESVIGYLQNGLIIKRIQKHSKWQGTVISMIIDLYNTLPLLDIYAAMPAPSGFEEDGFFDE